MIRKYKGCFIHPATRNSAGIRYYAYTSNGVARADTLAEIKQAITELLTQGGL